MTLRLWLVRQHVLASRLQTRWAFASIFVRRERTTTLLRRNGRSGMEIQSLLANTRTKLVAQNGHYDATWLWFKDRISVHAHWFDTMLAHHFLYPGLPHDLGFHLCPVYRPPALQGRRSTMAEEGDIDAFWRYNVTDCCITRMAMEKMEQELVEHGLHERFHIACHAAAA